MGIMGTLTKRIGQQDNIDNMHKITIQQFIISSNSNSSSGGGGGN